MGKTNIYYRNDASRTVRGLHPSKHRAVVSFLGKKQKEWLEQYNQYTKGTISKVPTYLFVESTWLQILKELSMPKETQVIDFMFQARSVVLKFKKKDEEMGI